MMKFNILRFLKTASAVVAVAAILQAPTAFGQLNIIWTGATDTDWNTAGNWNAGVPGNLDNAFIIDGAATPATVSVLVPTVAGIHVGQGGALAADFNSSGNVDGVDLTIWESAFGLNANGDADNDADSDGRDFLSWQRQFGQIANGNGQIDIVAGGDLTATNFISLGSDSGRNGTLNVSGGSLTTGNIFSGNSSDVNPSLGTANFSGGTISASGRIFSGAGNNSAGSSVTQSGTALVTTGGLNVGEASTASYTLSGGTLNVTNPGGFDGVRIGNGAQGTFTHSGGTVTTSGAHFAVGVFAQGTYSMPIGSTGIVNITGGGQLLLGNEDSGAGSLFDQDGGTVNSNTLTVIGRGSAVPSTYDISDGALNTPNIQIGTSTSTSGSSFIQSGGIVTTPNISIGFNGGGNGGAGSYTLSGGTLDMLGTSLIQVGGGADSTGSSLSASGGILNVNGINAGAFAQGTVNISGTADVNVASSMQIGATANAAGSSLVQSGGDLTVLGTVFTGVGGSGSYTVSGGTTSIVNLHVGQSSQGTLTLSAGGTGVVNVTNDLVIGTNVGAAGSTVNVDGGSLTADQIKIADGEAATMNVSGGTVTAANVAVPENPAFIVGNNSAGTINQTGGTVNNTGNFSLGHNAQGTYNLSGPEATSVFNSGQLIIGFAGTGASGSSLNQMGGTVNSAGTRVGRKSQAEFQMSGGQHNTAGLAVATDDGAANPDTAGSLVNHTGGTITVTGNVSVGVTAAASYSISGTSILNAENLSIGSGDTLNGSSMTQTGGTVNVPTSGPGTGFALIGDMAQATYSLSAGTLNADIVSVSTNVNSGGSSMTQTGGTVNAATLVGVGASAAGSYTISGAAVLNTPGLGIADSGAFLLTGSAGSTFTQTGGTVDIAGGLNIGNTNSALDNGIYAISGGTLDFDGAINIISGSTLTVTGSGGTITDTAAVGDGLTVTDGTVDFDFVGNAISTINLATAGTDLTRLAASTITVDGGAYTGGNGTFTLISFGGLGAGDLGWGSTTVTGFGAATATLVETATTVDLVITGALSGISAVPEPSTAILLLLGFAGVASSRRRNRR